MASTLIPGVFTQVKVESSADAPYVNDLVLPFSRLNETVSLIRFTLRVALNKAVTVAFEKASQGEFFSDAAGTASLGSSITYSAGGAKTLYMKAYTDGKIIVRAPENITKLGGDGNGTDWGPTNKFIDGTSLKIINFDIASFQLAPLLSKIVLEGSDVYGDISTLSALPLAVLALTTTGTYGTITGDHGVFINMASILGWNITGVGSYDVKSLPKNANTIQILAATLTNTGGTAAPAMAKQLNYFSVRGTVKLSTTETDNLIITLSNSLPAKTANTNLTMSSQGRTSASDAAIATLTNKFYTVVLV